jgi:hypothetical protein
VQEALFHLYPHNATLSGLTLLPPPSPILSLSPFLSLSRDFQWTEPPRGGLELFDSGGKTNKEKEQAAC